MKTITKTGIIAGLIIIVVAVGFIPNILQIVRIILGSVYVLFLPGFIITFIFFPAAKKGETGFTLRKTDEEGIDWIERIALSFALSIAIVPLVVFYLNLIGLKITFLNTFLTILGIIVISLALCRYRKNIISLSKKNEKHT